MWPEGCGVEGGGFQPYVRVGPMRAEPVIVTTQFPDESCHIVRMSHVTHV